MPSSRNSRSGDEEAEGRVPPGQRGLRVQDDVSAPAGQQRGLHQLVPESVAPCGRGEHDAADPPHITVIENPGVAEQLVGLAEHDVAGAGLEVATVQIGVGAGLLDDEDVLAEPPQVVGSAGVELVEGEHRADHPSHSRLRPALATAHRASGSVSVSSSGRGWLTTR